MQAVQKQAKARKDQSGYYKKWLAKNPNYFKKYYKGHSKAYAKSHGKYMDTAKGKLAGQKFETSEKRLEYKRKWMRDHRKAIKQGTKRKGKRRGAKKKNG